MNRGKLTESGYFIAGHALQPVSYRNHSGAAGKLVTSKRVNEYDHTRVNNNLRRPSPRPTWPDRLFRAGHV